jgi:hypothetical protein
MTAFSVSPVGTFPPAEDDGFPQFIQWQALGVDLGGPDADTVDFESGLTATRGTGENANVITVDASGIQWELNGTPLGDTNVNTVNIGPGLTAERGTGDQVDTLLVEVQSTPPSSFIQWQQDGIDVGDPFVIVVDVISPLMVTHGTGLADDTIQLLVDLPSLDIAWRDVPADYTVVLADNRNGLSTSGTTGTQNINILGDIGDPTVDLPDGASVIVYQEGAASFDITAESGVALNVRSGLLPISAGQFATVTLIKRRTNTWIVCGDLELAS